MLVKPNQVAGGVLSSSLWDDKFYLGTPSISGRLVAWRGGAGAELTAHHCPFLRLPFFVFSIVNSGFWKGHTTAMGSSCFQPYHRPCTTAGAGSAGQLVDLTTAEGGLHNKVVFCVLIDLLLGPRRGAARGRGGLVERKRRPRIGAFPAWFARWHGCDRDVGGE